MVVETNQLNETNKQNPTIDTGLVTVNAFNVLRNKEKNDKNFILGRDDKLGSSPVHKVKVKAWTQDDDQTHTYFHSLSIDVQVEDFMGTAELKCPYDSDLMEYWEPIRQTVVIYGANKGDYKILFIGRVREVKQDGYELVITFQNYGWKFKQLVTQSYANDNVLNKDGYTIMRLMFEALKIDSYVISESAKNRLKEVGINEDGNLTNNGEEIEEMPDLLERLKKSDPSKLVSKDTLNDKLREKYLHNIKDINYTLKYEEPTPVMKEIASQGNYTAGNTIYANPYGSASGGGAGADGTNASALEASMKKGGCTAPSVSSYCPSVPGDVQSGITEVYLYHRGCTQSYDTAWSVIMGYAQNHPQTYTSNIRPCLATLSKYTRGGGNAASHIMSAADAIAAGSGTVKAASNAISQGVNAVQQLGNNIVKGGQQIAQQAYNTGKSLWDAGVSAVGKITGLW